MGSHVTPKCLTWFSVSNPHEKSMKPTLLSSLSRGGETEAPCTRSGGVIVGPGTGQGQFTSQLFRGGNPRDTDTGLLRGSLQSPRGRPQRSPVSPAVRGGWAAERHRAAQDQQSHRLLYSVGFSLGGKGTRGPRFDSGFLSFCGGERGSGELLSLRETQPRVFGLCVILATECRRPDQASPPVSVLGALVWLGVFRGED